MRACLDRIKRVFLSPQRKLHIKGGTVVNADRQFAADVYCEDGIIRFAGPRKRGRKTV